LSIAQRMRIALFDMFPEWPLARQTPGGALRWGATEFVINPSAGRFDGCVVFDGLLGETMIDCPGDRTVFIAGEPPSIKLYHTGFLGQFATVVTCHSDTPHPRKLHVQQGYPWHIGVTRRDGGLVATLDYDAFRAAPPPEKEKLISVIVSDKAVTPGHAHRRAFVARLQQHFGARLDIFGRGIRPIADKADGILPYRYHVALENSEFPDYWTEKLADSFLGFAHPLYWGCPNLARYFPAGSFTMLNIHDPAQAIATIEQAIGEDRFERSREAVAAARDRVLERYNLFALAGELVGAASSRAAGACRLKPESVFRDSLSKKLRQRLRRTVPRRFRRKAPAL
jgi:Glycosyltransferase family 10 (fucosyltransferase) C-term